MFKALSLITGVWLSYSATLILICSSLHVENNVLYQLLGLGLVYVVLAFVVGVSLGVPKK